MWMKAQSLISRIFRWLKFGRIANTTGDGMEAWNDLNRLECWAFTKWEVRHLAGGAKQPGPRRPFTKWFHWSRWWIEGIRTEVVSVATKGFNSWEELFRCMDKEAWDDWEVSFSGFLGKWRCRLIERRKLGGRIELERGRRTVVWFCAWGVASTQPEVGKLEL